MKSSAYFLFVISICFYSCNMFNKRVESCMENPGNNKLLIFVGEKIEVKEIEPDKSEDPLELRYGKFKARYKVLDVVCGDFIKDTIEFIAYDHYGSPPFQKFEHVLLYVYNYKDTFYHERYMFDEVYKAKNGEWVSPYSAENYERIDLEKSHIKPRKIDFEKPLSFDLKGFSRQRRARVFPAPYFIIEGRKAIAVYGNYIHETVQLKKEGILKARGYFGTEEDTRVKVSDVTLADIASLRNVKMSKKEEVVLKDFFNKIVQAIKVKDSAFIRNNSVDSVYCSVCEGYTADEFVERFRFENNLETVDSFLISAFRNLPKSLLFEKMQNGNYKIMTEHYIPAKPDTVDVTHKNEEVIYTVSVFVPSPEGGLKFTYTHEFEFVIRNGQFKFYGMKTTDNAWY